MLSVEKLNEILDEAEDLAERREFRALVTYLESMAPDFADTDPTTSYLLAYGKCMSGDEVAARERILSLAAMCEHRPNDRLNRRVKNLEAIVEIERGNLVRGEEMLIELRCLAEAADDQRYVAFATLNHGIAMQMRGAADEAIFCFQRATTAFQKLGEQAALAGCAHNLGIAYRELNRFEASESQFLIARDYFSVNGSIEELVTTDIERALLLTKRGELGVAEKMARISLSIAGKIHNFRLRGEALRALGIVALEKGSLITARRLLVGAVKVARTNGVALLEAEVIAEIARVEYLEGNLVCAADYCLQASTAYLKLGAIKKAEWLAQEAKRYQNR